MYQFNFSGAEGITHYLRLAHFEALVRSRCLYLRRQDLQEKDLADGVFPSANKTAMHGRDVALMQSLGQSPEKARALANNYQGGNEYMRQRHYLHCWTLRDQESAWMWENHGFRGEGVCIKTTIRRLCEAAGRDWFLGHHGGKFYLKIDRVVYTEEGEPFPTWPSDAIAFRKIRIPHHENEAEVRLLASDYKVENPVGPEAQHVPVALDRLFEAVYLGGRISPEEFSRIEALTNGAAGSRVVRPSSINW